MAGFQFIGWQQNERESAQLGTYTLDRRLYLDADGKVVEEGSADAAFLLGAKGSEMPMREAVKLGLIDKDEAAAKLAEKLADKAAKAPADKAVRRKEDKGGK